MCYHGALVVDATTGEGLRHLTIPMAAATGIVREAVGLGLSVTLYEGDDRRELDAAAQLVVSQDSLAETLRRAAESLG